MNDYQLDLITDIIREQLSEYLADALVVDLVGNIREGICDNMMLFEELAEAKKKGE